MRTRLIFKIAGFLVFLSAVSIEGLFFQYPKNALIDFFQSLHKKKEPPKPPNNINHYHVHYYPVHTEILTKPIRAPDKIELGKLHNYHLESLGWSDKEYQRIPEPEIYSSGTYSDPWPEPSLNRPWIWEESPENLHEPAEPSTFSKTGILVQVPLHQNIIIHQTPALKEENRESNPLVSFFRKIRQIKNSLFSDEQNDPTHDTDYWQPKRSYDDKTNGYGVYLSTETGKNL